MATSLTTEFASSDVRMFCLSEIIAVAGLRNVQSEQPERRGQMITIGFVAQFQSEQGQRDVTANDVSLSASIPGMRLRLSKAIDKPTDSKETLAC